MGKHSKKPSTWSNIALAVLGFGTLICFVAGTSLIYIYVDTGSMTSPPNEYVMTGGPSH